MFAFAILDLLSVGCRTRRNPSTRQSSDEKDEA
jgi:hypothetical protein